MSMIKCPHCQDHMVHIGDPYCEKCFGDLSALVEPPPPAPVGLTTDPLGGSTEPERPPPPLVPADRRGAVSSVRCRGCGEPMPGERDECPNCGARQYVLCPAPGCGVRNPPGMRYCRVGGPTHPLPGAGATAANDDPVRKPPPPTDFVLVLLDRDGNEAGRFPLRAGENVVGAASPGEGHLPDVDLNPFDPDGYVSRTHAVLTVVAGRVTVTHRSDKNPTAVDGRSVPTGETRPVPAGATLRFSQLLARLTKPGPEARP